MKPMRTIQRFAMMASAVGLVVAVGIAVAQQSGSASPVDFFRHLLKLEPTSRDRALTTKSPMVREFLLKRVAEYESLAPNEREFRLKATELRHYLRPLMDSPIGDRVAQLRKVPIHVLPLVQQRLAQWDKLSPATQREVLENEWMLHAVLRFGQGDASVQIALSQVPEEKRSSIENQIAAWKGIPSVRQQEILGRFSQFFALNQVEKNRVLQQLPELQRDRLAPTLRGFENLSPEQRRACLIALQRFSAMSSEQQQMFMKNAELWRGLSDVEKHTWRRVVSDFPPLPPGAGMPPLPPGLDGSPAPSPIRLLTGK